MARWVRVAAVEECPAGKLTGVLAENLPVVLANVEGRICALEDECTHEQYPLSDGDLEGGDIVCIYHGARFDACTGANKALPAVLPVKSFPVEIREGEVFVDIE